MKRITMSFTEILDYLVRHGFMTEEEKWNCIDSVLRGDEK